MHTVNNTIDSQNVMVYLVYHTIINKDAVWITGIFHHQLSVVHVRHLNLSSCSTCSTLRERIHLEIAILVATVNDTVIDYNLTDRV